jgi:hypothetical protein
MTDILKEGECGCVAGTTDSGVWSAKRAKTLDKEGGVVSEVKVHMLVSVKS